MPESRTIQCGCGASHTPEHPHFGDQADVPEQWFLDAGNTIRDLKVQLAERDARLTVVVRQLSLEIKDRDALVSEVEAMRGALEEMLESFTEPEDDNDIIRRAKAALDQGKKLHQTAQDRQQPQQILEQHSGGTETGDSAEGPENGLK